MCIRVYYLPLTALQLPICVQFLSGQNHYTLLALYVSTCVCLSDPVFSPLCWKPCTELSQFVQLMLVLIPQQTLMYTRGPIATRNLISFVFVDVTNHHNPQLVFGCVPLYVGGIDSSSPRTLERVHGPQQLDFICSPTSSQCLQCLSMSLHSIVISVLSNLEKGFTTMPHSPDKIASTVNFVFGSFWWWQDVGGKRDFPLRTRKFRVYAIQCCHNIYNACQAHFILT